MTTESKQDTRRGVSPLLGAAAAGAAVVVVLAAVGAAADGSAGFAGAGAGGGLALVVFLGGTAAVRFVASAMPSASLLVALLTYTLQLVAMALVIAALERSGVAGDSLSRGWFAAAVIAVTLAWLAVQTWLSTRLRIPAYDDARVTHPGGEA